MSTLPSARSALVSPLLNKLALSPCHGAVVIAASLSSMLILVLGVLTGRDRSIPRSRRTRTACLGS
eukprot:12929579-Prorocentrum_lima.AAC.1